MSGCCLDDRGVAIIMLAVTASTRARDSSMMAKGAFTDKEHEPTMEETLATVGSKRGLWEDLIQFIADKYRARGDFKFYGKNYGWALRFRKGGKALVSLYPGQDSLVVQLIIGPTQAEEAFRLTLGKNARKALEDAHPYPEGRWLFIGVESGQDLADVQRLLMAKARPVQRRK
jgi:hypothetical protein